MNGRKIIQAAMCAFQSAAMIAAAPSQVAG